MLYSLGEFGVVYKAEYAKPMEDEILIVAVKTLKGKEIVEMCMQCDTSLTQTQWLSVLNLYIVRNTHNN